MKTLLMATLALAGFCAPAYSQTVEQRLVAELTGQGYTILEDGHTFLGRLRIVAENETLYREIVVNPSTGEVFRDYAVALADMTKPGSSDSSSHASTDTVASAAGAATGSGAGIAASAAASGVGTRTAGAVMPAAGLVGGLAGSAGTVTQDGIGSGTMLIMADPIVLSPRTAP